MRLSITLIYDALYRMGFKANCTGFFYLSYSLYLCFCCPEPKTLSTGWIYPKVSQHYQTRLQNIRPQIEAAISRAWQKDDKKIAEITGRSLEKCPSDIEIIWYLYEFIAAQYIV